MNSDSPGRYETWGSVFAAGPDRVCESSLRTCRYVSSPSPTRGNPVYNQRNPRDAKYDRKSALGDGRNTSGRVVRDHSVTEEISSAPGVRSQARRRFRFRPLSTKMCVVVYTDSSLHNADADTDDEGSDDEWLARAKQKGIRVRSQHGALVCVVNQDDLEKNRSHSNDFDDLEEQGVETNHPVYFRGRGQCMSGRP